MERIFALYDSDSFYATRFMDYFKKRKEFNFEFSAFTRKESLEEFLSTHSIEIILLGSRDLAEGLTLTKVRHVYVLTEEPMKDEEGSGVSIYKYQPASTLMAEIISDYNRKENTALVHSNSRQVKFISVFSPVPGIEALTFAWSLGLSLAVQKKVLLVMLDPLPVQTVACVPNDNPMLTEYIFYLKENKDSILKMTSLLGYKGNLAYLTGITNASDILSLTKEDIKKWIEEITTCTDYYCVIFYLCIHNDAATEILENSDHVFLPDTGTRYEEEVGSAWSRQMEYSKMSTNTGKYMRIRLQKEEYEQIPLSDTELRNTSAWSSARQCMKTIG